MRASQEVSRGREGAVQCTPAGRHIGLAVTAQIRVCGADSHNEVVIQHTQNSDLNIDNLAFFYSLQTSMSSVAKHSRCKLLDTVRKCWGGSHIAYAASAELGDFHGQVILRRLLAAARTSWRRYGPNTSEVIFSFSSKAEESRDDDSS